MQLNALMAFFCLAVLPTTFLGQSVIYNPYESVDWVADTRCYAQFHDHLTTVAKLRAYDNADYCFASYFTYSGNPRLDYAWNNYRWPVDNFLGAGTEASLTNLKLFPNIEQIGPQHWTSPWIESYIEYKPGGAEEFQYSTIEEAFQMARDRGALPILAHPWGGQDSVSGMHAVEIYNAYGLNQFLSGQIPENLSDKLIPYWDRKLKENPRLFGVAVNDWYGAASSFGPAWAQDTGKQILLVKERSSAAAKQAFRGGAMFALFDQGEPKGNYPRVNSIDVGPGVIRIDTDGEVRWISDGTEIATGTQLDLSAVLGNYVRAEISNQTSVLYTQPWEVATTITLCDFNHDDECNMVDIDSLTAIGNLVAGISAAEAADPIYDVNKDGQINSDDLHRWLQVAGEQNGFSSSLIVGDANLDGTIDQADLNALGLHWLSPGEWSGGDFNGDGVVNASDLNFVGLNWLTEVPRVNSGNAARVPEPRSLGHSLEITLIWIVGGGRRKVRRADAIIPTTRRSYVCPRMISKASRASSEIPGRELSRGPATLSTRML
jgi:hypothetical protein